ncbi:hypothetical protein [Idiomarina xiamenensis]|uniref:Uncharacterized protein n=1 Tax=Idiomarina xiamenensis 10-D-4 TaxID=740709 RepID=K2JUA5_9GAMM|nr:hypothetical protein [Idiomarina xiamenensis]EKE79068.1 hypothetical protein A10D4_13258 [Idiomarina xiamenensis 10-D-4]
MKFLKQYQPELFGVIVAVSLLNIWYLVSITVEEAVLPKSYDYFINGLTVLVGAFIGSFSAFWLKSSEEKRKEDSRKSQALNEALFTIYQQLNSIAQYRKLMAEATTDHERAFQLPAIKGSSYSSLKLRVNDDLMYLLDVDASLLMELSIEQERFELAMLAIENRNDLLVREIQPLLSRYKHDNKRDLDEGDYEAHLEPRLYLGGIQAAQHMYYHVNESRQSLREVFQRLRALAVKLFPDGRFIDIQFDTQ